MFQKLLLGVLVCCTLVQITWSNKLHIQDVRGWRKWDAQITQVEFTATIEGLFARNAVTLSIKDTLSNSQFDSLEAVFTFDLPKDAVIDSMYLWINGKPEPAYLKCAWNATIIYENIVNRRIDPALLKKNGTADNYTIKIFPFMPRQERTIKICYTTILTPFAGNLLHTIPLNITSPSCFPTEDIVSNTMLHNVAKKDVSVFSNNQGEANIISVPRGTRIQFIDHNNHSIHPLSVYINNHSYASKGYMVNFSKDKNGETFFTALLHPGKALKLEKPRKRKVLIIWNNAMLFRRYRKGNENNRINPGYKYTYSSNANSFYNYHKDKADIAHFLNNHLQQGDQFNVIMNNKDISTFKETLVPFNSDTYFKVTKYIDKSLPIASFPGGCRSPLEALDSALSTVPNQDSLIILVVDKQYHSYYGWYDTLLVTNQIKNIITKLPKVKSIFWCVQPNRRSFITEAYRTIMSKTPGALIPFNGNSPVSSALKSVAHYLSEKIYPAKVTFSDPIVRFPYDIIGPSQDNIYARIPCLYTGKIYKSKAMNIEMNGVVDGKEHTFSKTFRVRDNLTAIPTVSDYWAGLKVDNILSRNDLLVSDKKEALNTSLQYRILTSMTALLALEKWLADSLNMADDKPSQSDTFFIINENNPTGIEDKPAHGNAALTMTSSYSRNNLTITIPQFSQIKDKKDITLKLFDMKGRLKINLTNKMMTSNGNINWHTEALSSGMYIIRLQIGTTVISKQILITQ